MTKENSDYEINYSEKFQEDISKGQKVQGMTFGDLSIEDIEQIEIDGEEGKDPKDIQETQNNLSDNIYKKYQEIKKDNEIIEADLNDYEVEEIYSASRLESVVLYVGVKDSEGHKKNIGIPGFYDSSSGLFFLLDGSPLNAKGFKEKFKEFVKKPN